MKALRTSRELLAEARQLEEASRLTEAAAAYQQLVDADATNQQAVTRLLTIYRRLKEPRKELAVIEHVLSAYAQKNKASKDKWLSAHPQAARAGRAFLRSLGNTAASGFGANSIVERLLKRKEVVEKKLHGKGGAKTKGKTAQKKPAATDKKANAAAKKAVAASARKAEVAAGRKAEAAASKEKRAEERRVAAEEKAAAKAAKLAAQRAEKEAVQRAKKQAMEQAAAAIAAAAEAARPSLFVITLRYLARSEKIDVLQPKHAAFLDKHFAAGDFLVAGPQTPETGSIIIAKGKDRISIERIMKQDPLVQRRLASQDIVEFSVSQLDKKQWQQLL